MTNSVPDPTGTTCLCVTGFYYDPFVVACFPCDYTCLNCTGSTNVNCLVCDPLMIRSFDFTNNSCPCDPGYFDPGVALCAPCDYTCMTCSGPSNTQCIGCDFSMIRTPDFSNNSCPCNVGFFDAGVALCAPCDYTCLSCVAPLATSCVTCDSTLPRAFDPTNNSCPCNPGYFDPGTATCAPCDYTCLTCSGPTGTDCLTCDPLNIRTFSPINSSCPCDLGYFDNGVPLCMICGYTCLTCNGPTITSCLACDPAMLRTFDATNSCPCNIGYFDNGVSLCVACDYTCLNCTGSANVNCLVCDPLMIRTFDFTNNSCPCNPGYFDSGIALCAPCDYTCMTCNGLTNTMCVVCNSSMFRTFDFSNNSCPCNIGYYDGGVALCAACDYTCLTCIASLQTNCVTCNSTLFRTFNPMNSSCPCDPGYFDSGVALCAPCDYTCLTCSGPTSTTCVTCDASMMRTISAVNNSCPCNAGFFDSGVSLCAACDYTCLTCNGPSNTFCVTCNSAMIRTLNPSNNSCPCNVGYYNSGLPMCAVCDYTCLTCNGPSSINCTSCNSTNFRILAGGACQCQPYYYDPGTALCNACDYTCLTCNGPASPNCLTCDPANHRSWAAPGKCDCNTLYVDVGVKLCALAPCLTGYEHDSMGACVEICGDGIRFDLACDDGNLVDGDGCSSTCTIETNYTCKGGNSTSASICGYNQPLVVTLLDAQKSPAANEVVFTLDISPVLPLLNSLNFSQIFSTTLNSMGTVSFTYDGNGSLVVVVSYNQSIQSSDVQLILSPSVSGGFAFAMPDTIYQFKVDPTNNIAADYLNDGVYHTTGIMDTCFKVVGYVSLASFVLALFTSKFIGIEMIGVVQVAYIALIMINQLHPFLASIKYINFVNGPNSAFLNDRLTLTNPLPNRITALEYLPPIAYSLNYSLILLLFPPLFSLIFYLLAKYYKNPDEKLLQERKQTFQKWAELALGEWGLTAIMFIFYNSLVSFAVTCLYYRTTELLGLSIFEGVVVLAYLVSMLVLFKIRPKFFGDYKLGFKQDKFSQMHYWLFALDRMLLATLMVAANNISEVGFMCMPIPILAGAYLIWRRPYEHFYNTIRQTLNQTVLLILLLIYGYYRKVVTYLQHFTNGNEILPFVVLALLFVCIIYNVACMLKYWWDCRQEQIEME